MAQSYEGRRAGDEGRNREPWNEEERGNSFRRRGGYDSGVDRRGYQNEDRSTNRSARGADRYGPQSGENFGVGGFDDGVYQGYSTNTGYGHGHYDDQGRGGWTGRGGAEGSWSPEGGYGPRPPQSVHQSDGWAGEVGYGYGRSEPAPSARPGDADPGFRRYVDEHLSGYDRHYQTWRGEQEKKLRAEYEKYQREQHAKWSQDFESWRGSQAASPGDEPPQSGTAAKNS